jgi:hypothetical protein
MQALANKAFLGNGIQGVAAPKQRIARNAVSVQAAAVSTKLNTKRSEEVRFILKISIDGMSAAVL